MNRQSGTLIAGGIALALAAGTAGFWLGGGNAGIETASSAAGASGKVVNGVVQDGSGRQVLYWYDPMVPGQRFEKPGKSPSMDMQLVPKYADEATGGVKISPAMAQSLGVRIGEAEVVDLRPAVKAVGRIEVDERRIVEVQTLTPGYVEQLSVRAEGELVRAGARVANVYAPDLLAAQQEYAALLKMPHEAVSSSLRQAARQRLKLLGLPDGVIHSLDRGGRPQRTYGVFAPMSGIVTAIGARPGAKVETGQSVVTLANLSQVWAVAEIPEVALGEVKVGQPVEVSFPAYPGEVRRGRIDYIYPTLDAEARTVRVRATLANPGLALKAGMFANMTIRGEGGQALVVPSEAVISTGRRNVTIVKRDGAFVPVEVKTDREVNEQTEILAGLRKGDQVVLSGQFLIDSEASLSGVLARLDQSSTASTQAQAKDQRESQAALARTNGIIQAIDPSERRVTIAHDAVPAVGWPAMTMSFVVADAAQLRGFKRGDRVSFGFNRIPGPSGAYTIERIVPEGGR